jgi:hypothetical protein
MKFTQLKSTPTAENLNDRVAKMFGSKIKLDAFTPEQLTAARDKLANQLQVIENQANFDAIHSSESYQKNRLFLKVIEQRIAELSQTDEKAKSPYAIGMAQAMKSTGDTPPLKKSTIKKAHDIAKSIEKNEGELDEVTMTRQHFELFADVIKQIEDPAKRRDTAKMVAGVLSQSNPRFDHARFMVASGAHQEKTDDHMDTALSSTKAPAEAVAQAKPDFLDMDKDGDKKEPMKKAIQDKEKDKKQKDIKEGAEDTAKIVMAANSMVDKITGWLEDTAKMQTEVNLDLGDEIRNEMGSEKAEEFIAAMKPAIEQLYSQLENIRKTFTGGVAVLTGEEAPATLGADAPTNDIEDLETEVEPEVTPDTADDFAASEPATGGEEPADRKKRESIIRNSPKLAEMLSRPWFIGKKKS